MKNQFSVFFNYLRNSMLPQRNGRAHEVDGSGEVFVVIEPLVYLLGPTGSVFFVVSIDQEERGPISGPL